VRAPTVVQRSAPSSRVDERLDRLAGRRTGPVESRRRTSRWWHTGTVGHGMLWTADPTRPRIGQIEDRNRATTQGSGHVGCLRGNLNEGPWSS